MLMNNNCVKEEMKGEIKNKNLPEDKSKYDTPNSLGCKKKKNNIRGMFIAILPYLNKQ